MAWVVELGYFDPRDATEKTVCFALGPGLALPDHAWIAPGLTKWASPTQKVVIDPSSGIGTASADAGEIDITNLPTDIGQGGAFDWLATKIVQGRAATLYWLGATWAGRTVCDTGVMEQPVINVSLGTQAQSYFAFPLRDPRSLFTANLQPALYAGSNTGGAGVEGTAADIKGAPKPVLIGRASNIPGVAVNTSLLVWQIADAAATVDCVRDGGVSITVGTVRATLASLLATAPPPGGYDVYAGSEGTFVRLGSTPQFSVTFDAYEGASRTPAQVWSRLRARCGTTNLDAATVTACDALDSGESGFWWNQALSQISALDECLAGFAAYEFLTAAGLWSVQKIAEPSAVGVSILDLARLGPTSRKTAKTRDLISVQAVRPDYSPKGAPPYQVNVQWGRNYTVMSASNFAGSAIRRLHDKFGLEWRVATASNLANWNPATGYGPWKNAPSMTLPSGYQAQPDGTCPAASTEAARLLALFGVVRGQWQVSFRPEIGDRVALGSVVGFSLASFNLSAGALFRVLQSAFTVDANGAQAAVIIGLQRLPGDA